MINEKNNGKIQKRLSITKDGKMTWCTAPEDKIGYGRCNHICHQTLYESPESFGIRAESILNAFENIDSFENIDNYEEIDKLISVAGMQTKFYNVKGNEFIKLDSDNVAEGLSEELISNFLDFTNVEHVKYRTDYVCYKGKPQTCCISENFIPNNGNNDNDKNKVDCNSYSHITFKDLISGNEVKELYKNKTMKEQFDSLFYSICSRIGKAGGKYDPSEIKSYMLQTIALDCITLNPDRHMGNLGFVVRKDKVSNEFYFKPNPQFDNGLALCSNYKENMCNLSYSSEEVQQLTPMSMFSSDEPEDYIDLYFECLDELENNGDLQTLKNSLITIKSDRYDEMMKTLNDYTCDMYGTDIVNRSKKILISRLIELEDVLWTRK